MNIVTGIYPQEFLAPEFAIRKDVGRHKLMISDKTTASRPRKVEPKLLKKL
jgi:hypothetical protein